MRKVDMPAASPPGRRHHHKPPVPLLPDGQDAQQHAGSPHDRMHARTVTFSSSSIACPRPSTQGTYRYAFCVCEVSRARETL